MRTKNIGSCEQVYPQFVLFSCSFHILWFISEVAEDALSLANNPQELDYLDNAITKLKEICLISMPTLIITVEAGIGNKTLPMLMLKSGFQGNVKNWSSQVTRL